VFEEVRAVYHKWIHTSDKHLLDTVFATVISNEIAGDPVFLFVVGAPAGKKTETVRMLCHPSNMFTYSIDTITPRTLISGRQNAQDMLPQLSGKTLIIKDFTTILTMRDDVKNQIFSDLRAVYDGYLEKSFGSGVQKKSYQVHMSIIAAVTPVIDNYHVTHELLGERFLKIRTVSENGDAAFAMKNTGLEGVMRAELQSVAMRFVYDAIKEHRDILNDISRVEMNIEQKDKVMALADVVSVMRSGVVRDRQGIVLAVPEPEVSTRLTKQFTKLMVSSAIINDRYCIAEQDCELVSRLARDTIPATRMRVIKILYHNTKEMLPTKKIALAAGLPTTTMRTVLEDLWMLSAVDKQGSDDVMTAADKWAVNPKMMDKLVQSEIFEYSV